MRDDSCNGEWPVVNGRLRGVVVAKVVVTEKVEMVAVKAVEMVEEVRVVVVVKVAAKVDAEDLQVRAVGLESEAQVRASSVEREKAKDV